MNLASKLDAFRSENPYDIATQAKRLLASNDATLIKYVIELGLTLAKQRQRHEERQYIKETGNAPPTERLIVSPGRVTGSVIIKPSKRGRNAMRQLILDTWRINGDQPLGSATDVDLCGVIERQEKSMNGMALNIQLYEALRKPLIGTMETVRVKWSESAVRAEIKKVYGEFRTAEAA